MLGIGERSLMRACDNRVIGQNIKRTGEFPTQTFTGDDAPIVEIGAAAQSETGQKVALVECNCLLHMILTRRTQLWAGTTVSTYAR